MASNPAQMAEFESMCVANLSSHNPTRAMAESALLGLRASNPSGFMMALLQLLSIPSANAQAREFAAVILRQQLLVNSSSTVWANCPPETHKQIQAGLLHLFSSERTPSLRRKITDAVAATATRIAGALPPDFSTNDRGVSRVLAKPTAAPVNATPAPAVPVPLAEQAKWDELMPMVQALAQADAPEMRQSLLDLIDKLAEFNPSILHPPSSLEPAEKKGMVSYLPLCKTVIMRGLKDKNMAIRLSALRACIGFLVSLGEEDRPSMQECVPSLFEVLGSAFQEADDETIVTAVTVLSDLATVSPKFLKVHLKPILSAMVTMVACTNLEAETRRVAMAFLLTLAEEGKGMVRKAGEFAGQVVPLAFGLVQELEHTPAWDDPNPLHEGQDNDGQENYLFGCECIARLSTALGGKLFLQVISPLLERAFRDKEHWNVRHAALITIAHMAAGVERHMEPQLKAIMNNYIVPHALHDPHHRVRWAALDACAFLCDSYEPDFANDFVEPIFQILLANLQPSQPWRLIEQACLMFTDFARGLDRANLAPYLPQFLTAMVACLGMKGFPKVMEHSLAAVSSAAMVAEKDFVPFYAHFMPGVKQIISECTAEPQKKLRGKAIECLGMMAQAVGKEAFAAEVAPVMEALLSLLEVEKLSSVDPQHPFVVECMARICKVMGRSFAPYLPRIIPSLIVSARISDACVVVNEGEVNPYATKEGYSTRTVEVRQVGTQHISMNTSLVEEKSRAIRVLFEYISAMGADFFPYAEEVAAILVPSVRYQFDGRSESNVRTNSVMSLAPLMRCANEALASDPPAKAAYAQRLFNFMLPVLLEAIKVEYDLESLCEIVSELTDVIEVLPSGVTLTLPQIEDINILIRRLIIECLERNQKRDELAQSDDCDEAEQELIDQENAQEDEFLGYLYCLVNRAVKNSPALYAPSFNEHLYPVLNAMMRSDDVSLRTSAICMIAQVMEDAPQHAVSASYVEAMHGACLKSLGSDEDVALLQSATFGLGVCAMVAREAYAPHALPVMQTLAKLVADAEAAETAKAAAAAAAEAAAANKKGAGKKTKVLEAHHDHDEDEDGPHISMATDNALGAIAKIFICTYNSGSGPGSPMPSGVPAPACPPAASAIMSRWVHSLPCESDLIESRKIHDMLSVFVAANNPAIMGGESNRNLPTILGIMAQILGREEWEDVCEPATRDRFIHIFQAIQRQLSPPQLHGLFQAMSEEQRNAFAPFILPA